MRITIKSQTTSAAAIALLSLSVSWTAVADDDDLTETVVAVTPGGATVEGAAAIVETYGGSYSADVVVIQGNTYNFADLGGVRNVGRIDRSFNGVSGIAQVNQSTGSFENQANVVAMAVGGTAEGGYADISATVGVIYKDNTIKVKDAVLGSHITNSFNNMSGIAQVNQSSGGLNNQHNVVAIGIGVDGTADFIALSDAALASHTGNNVIEVEGDFEADVSMTNSFNNYSGIAQVNQVAGYGNTTAQTLTVNVNTINIP